MANRPFSGEVKPLVSRTICSFFNSTISCSYFYHLYHKRLWQIDDLIYTIIIILRL
ncbi:hypothetical protein BACCOP_00167 [Phocaeicola coprocola DSM 17136]|uniref:Uncharacterized protein n=1 Tax=Phocaeicola coprocola DSM 17136 TaxID=470145 RepID=B3JE78_9BACT|nr:hypothetical protein BACCOP_00167 [Phocaeicola coprocola DSM 17136]